VKLLQRGNRLVRLTPAGQSFLTEARLILKLTESAALLARRVAEGKAGSVNIGFTAASSYSYLPELVAACRQQLPDVELILKEMVSGDQLKRLGAGEIDIGLLRPPIPRSGLQFFRVKAERMIAAVPAGHKLAKSTTIGLPDLAAEPFIAYGLTRPVTSTTCWSSCFRAQHLRRSMFSTSRRSIRSWPSCKPASAWRWCRKRRRNCNSKASNYGRWRARSYGRPNSTSSGGMTPTTRCCR
jgi:DNA-binding transcriptional LysR family regulator